MAKANRKARRAPPAHEDPCAGCGHGLEWHVNNPYSGEDVCGFTQAMPDGSGKLCACEQYRQAHDACPPRCWTWTCRCGHHMHNESPEDAESSSRHHQAQHAFDAGADPKLAPRADADDAAWWAWLEPWRPPTLSMDHGTIRPGCAACSPPPPPAAPGCLPACAVLEYAGGPRRALHAGGCPNR